MAWVITKKDREVFSDITLSNFRDKVVSHALSKLEFNETNLADKDLFKIGSGIFDQHVHKYLGQYDEASYASYVFMVMLYFIKGIDEMEKPYIQDTLTNNRIGINTRVKCVYNITKMILRGEV